MSESAHRDVSGMRARKEPTQERSRHLVASVLEAATRILRGQGPSGLTVGDICEVAGVSPGSFYQYFPNKEAVVYALLRRHAERVTQAMGEVLAKHAMAPPEQLVSAAVDAFIEAHRDDPKVHSALGYMVATEAGPGLEEDLLGTAEQALGQLLEVRRTELGGRDPHVVAFLLMRTLESVVHAASRDEASLLHDPAFADGLKKMMVAVVSD